MANSRSGVAIFFIFLFLSVTVVLQIISMVQSNRMDQRLGGLIDTWKNTAAVNSMQNHVPASGPADKQYPGDAGDWLVWAFRVEPKTLNPISADTDIYAIWITVPSIFEPLLVYDHDNVTLEPWLAESYEVSSDGLEITFRLRDDIYFSDGEPVTTDDVIFTYETIVNPQIDAANIANMYVDVEKVVRLDDRVVKFFMKRPYFKSLETLSFTWSIGIFPKHIYQFVNAEDFNKHRSDPTGSGPYVFEKWAVGREVVLRRNENYWGPKPKLEKVVYRFIPNDLACLQALRSGQIDLMIPDPEQFADLVGDEQFNKRFRCLAYWTPWTPFYYIGWNIDTAFFSDKRVRRAMTHIIDRQEIVDQLLKGNGRVISGPFYINGGGNDPSIEPWPYDPERARQLLDEAGWVDSDGDGIRDKDGRAFSFKFSYSSSSTLYRRLATLLKDQALKVGIDLIPDPYEWSVLIVRLSDREFESMVMGWGGDIVEDFYHIFHSSQIGDRGSNYVGFANQQADAAMEAARRTFDRTERDRFSRQLHQILHDQQPYTFLFTRPSFRLVDRRFENVMIHKLGLKYLEWYVPKDRQRYK